MSVGPLSFMAASCGNSCRIPLRIFTLESEAFSTRAIGVRAGLPAAISAAAIATASPAPM